MKKTILFIICCISFLSVSAQTIDIIHLKNGLDARGTITNRTESQITIQTDNGRVLTFDMGDIESMEQEQKAFDPKVLIGRWACYKANGERDSRFDIEISENEGFYTVSYGRFVGFESNDGTIKLFPYDTPIYCGNANIDIEVGKGEVSYYFFRSENSTIYAHTRNERVAGIERYSCNVSLKYIDGKLKGKVDCLEHYCKLNTVECNDSPGGKWNVYFVKK